MWHTVPRFRVPRKHLCQSMARRLVVLLEAHCVEMLTEDSSVECSSGGAAECLLYLQHTCGGSTAVTPAPPGWIFASYCIVSSSVGLEPSELVREGSANRGLN